MGNSIYLRRQYHLFNYKGGIIINTTKLISNREVKSSAFTAYFSNAENAAQLYAALSDTEDITPEDIQFTTLAGVLFMARKNDLAFTVKNKILVISEHQSTINLNMPIRDTIYYGHIMEKLIPPRALYRTSQIPLPMPEFYVFYNGSANYPSEKYLKLSDAYLEKNNTPMLELIVKVININLPQNHPMLEKCRPLYEYSWFTQRIKDYIAEDFNRDEAILKAMEDCRQENIMEDFLAEHGAEAVNMLFTEFNMDDALEVRFEEGFEKGHRAGFEIGHNLGETHKLIELVCKKLNKKQSVSEIAASLEEAEDTIQTIFEAAKPFAPEYNVDKILQQLQKTNP